MGISRPIILCVLILFFIAILGAAREEIALTLQDSQYVGSVLTHTVFPVILPSPGEDARWEVSADKGNRLILNQPEKSAMHVIYSVKAVKEGVAVITAKYKKKKWYTWTMGSYDDQMQKTIQLTIMDVWKKQLSLVKEASHEVDVENGVKFVEDRYSLVNGVGSLVRVYFPSYHLPWVIQQKSAAVVVSPQFKRALTDGNPLDFVDLKVTQPGLHSVLFTWTYNATIPGTRPERRARKLDEIYKELKIAGAYKLGQLPAFDA